MTPRKIAIEFCACLALFALLGPTIASGRSNAAVRAESAFLTVDEALALAFPGAAIAKETHYLTAEQRARVEALAGEKLDSGVARPYLARDAAGALLGIAWFDSHVVRSKRETLMCAVDPCGTVLRIEVLAFAEPRAYLPRTSFYGQFVGQQLDDDLALDRDVRRVAGATITSRVTVAAARRALALQAVLHPAPQPQPTPAPEPLPDPTP